MSLACLECGRGGEFDTLVVHLMGDCSTDRSVSSLPNFYTCCVGVGSFKETLDGEFAVVQERSAQDSWCTGTNGSKLSECVVKRVSGEDLKAKLPRIHAALVQWAERKA